MDVVLIDNSELDLELYKTMLTRFGFKVHRFTELDALLFWLENNSPDIILIDLAMPENDGIEVAKELQKKNLSSRIGFLTGQEIDEAVIEAAKLYGVENILTKTSNFAELAENLRKWIE